MTYDPIGERRPHLGDPERIAQIDAHLASAAKRRLIFTKQQNAWLNELRCLKAADPVNFWALMVFAAIVVSLGGYWLGSTVLAIVSHDNGWQLVWQSLVETFSF